MTKPTKPSTKTSLATTPVFSSEADERAYWESHDSTDHLDWTTAQKVALPKLKPSPKPFHCGCRSIYSTRSKLLPIPATCLTSL